MSKPKIVEAGKILQAISADEADQQVRTIIPCIPFGIVLEFESAEALRTFIASGVAEF